MLRVTTISLSGYGGLEAHLASSARGLAGLVLVVLIVCSTTVIPTIYDTMTYVEAVIGYSIIIPCNVSYGTDWLKWYYKGNMIGMWNQSMATGTCIFCLYVHAPDMVLCRYK